MGGLGFTRTDLGDIPGLDTQCAFAPNSLQIHICMQTFGRMRKQGAADMDQVVKDLKPWV